MNTKFFAGLAIVGTAAAIPAYADVTVDITGSSAFRAATLASIKARFDASGVAYQYSHDKAAGGLNSSNFAIFKGTFPGVSGTTTIRTSFNGSVEGIRALVNSPTSDVPYYSNISGNFVTAAAIGGGETNKDTVGFAKTFENAQAEIAFSDVTKSSTPYSGFSLQPANAACGVVVFTMLTNEGSSVTNVTSQQFRALMATGMQPLSLFTGNAADETFVFGTGRNDLSGTRTTYLAETGYGITNPVKQFVSTASSTTALTTIQMVPAGGGASTPTFASTVWGQDVDGNGGYSSGGTLATAMGKTGAEVTVLDETGTDIFGAPVRADLVTFVALSDAVTARGNGAVFCSFNGVKLDDIAAGGSTLSTADKAKITNGLYTAWGYQQMYRRNDITSGDVVTVYNGIRNAIPANLGSTGIPISDMLVGRAVDGGIVAP
jgi:hypothetical protein